MSTFQEDLNDSQKPKNVEAARTILLREMRGAVEVVTGTHSEDRKGVDQWVLFNGGRREGVDIKFRKEDCRNFGYDDLVLEILSSIETGSIGWTLDQRKITDWILYLWLDTGRSCLVPYRPLRELFCKMWQEWQEIHPEIIGTTALAAGGAYHTRCVGVPLQIVLSAMKEYEDPRPHHKSAAQQMEEYHSRPFNVGEQEPLLFEAGEARRLT